MKKITPILFVLLFAIVDVTSAQCHYQDTTGLLHKVRTSKPYAISISSTGKVALSGARTDTFGARSIVKIWNDVYDFMSGFPPSDSLKLTAVTGLIYGNADRLYILQSQRPDSNILVYTSDLDLINVINNSSDATAWGNPRAISLDSLQNLYITSGNSSPGTATGKLIKITDPLFTATRSVLLSSLNDPRAVVVKNNRIYISEGGTNKVKVYSLDGTTALDSVLVTDPYDLAIAGCRLYTSQHGSNAVNIYNSGDLSDAGTATGIAKPTGGNDKFGIQLNASKCLFICRNDSNNVAFYRGVTPLTEGGGSGAPGLALCVGSYSNHFQLMGLTGEWSSLDTGIVSIAADGVIHATGLGYTNIYNITATGIDTFWISVEGPLSPLAANFVDSAGVRIYMHTSVCYTNSVRIRNDAASSNDFWTSSNSSVAPVDAGSGLVWPQMEGSTIISLHRSNSCNSFIASYTLDVTGEPNAGHITGDTIGCMNATLALVNSEPNGRWISRDTSVALVDSSSGIITPHKKGDVVIQYAVNNRCDFAVAEKSIHIDSFPLTGSIYGTDSVCISAHINLYDTTANATGYWHSNNDAVAIVDPLSGEVTGVAEGTADIAYIVKNACDSVYTLTSIRVKGKPHIGLLSGDNHVCEEATVTWSHPALVYPGTWSATGNVTISASGEVTGITHGTATISYIAENSCGADTSTGSITVNPLPHVRTLSGPSHVCPGATISLASTTTDTKVWSSLAPAIATISSSGSVGGVMPGSASIKLMVSNSCGSTDSTLTITVDSLPVAGTISGPTEVCSYSHPTFVVSGSVGVGAWSTSNPYVAIINSTGVMSVGDLGTVNIIHTSSTVCGVASASYSIITVTYVGFYEMVTSSPACVGSDDFVQFPESFGTVTDESGYSSNTAIVSAYHGWWSLHGIHIDYISPGTATIYYSGTNACGWGEAEADVTVYPLPAIGTISGPTSLCIGTTGSLSSTSTSTITWTSLSPAIATINSAGVIGGVSPGLANIKVTATTPCGSVDTLITIAVDVVPATGTITGSSFVCRGTTIFLSGFVPGGVWSTSDASIATVSSTGVVGGAAYIPSSATISYTRTTGCGIASTTFPINVQMPPNPGFITGADSLCMNSFDTVRNHAATPGGSWRSRHGLVQFLSATSGIDTIIFKGITAGNDTLVYTVMNDCGADSALFHVRVNALPLAGAIAGPTEVCVLSVISLSDPTGTPGGSWSSSAPWIADVDPVTGVVTGNSSGTSDIVYTGSTSCGSIPDVYTVTVGDLPSAELSAPAGFICQGSTLTLEVLDATYAGSWSSGDPLVATVDASSGIIQTVNSGTTTISYTMVSSFCGSYTATRDIFVNPGPFIMDIIGDDSVCSGSIAWLGDDAPGGTWSSSSDLIATVDAGGTVTGVINTMATAIITYTITDPVCGTASRTHAVTVIPVLSAGTLSGPAALCAGSSVTLTTSGWGGIWSSSSASVNINATTGLALGVSAGAATITYSAANTCSSGYATMNISVESLPSLSPITGNDSVCSGTTTLLAETTPGGTWVSGAPATVSVTPGGLATGISSTLSTAAIYYIVSSPACGADTVAHAVTVKPQPDAGEISGSPEVCAGNMIFMASTGMSGGAWSSSLPIATVNTIGMVTGINAGSTTISYTIINSCGTDYATMPVTVLTAPSAPSVSGADSFCVGTVSSFTGTPASGTWSFYYGFASVISATASIANLYASYAGYDTVYYAITNACGSATAARPIHLLTLPYTGYILAGADSLCPGNTTTVTDPSAAGGGIWGHTGSSISVTTAGVVTALTPGTDVVLYTLTNSCGSVAASRSITVHQLPIAGSISGPAGVCIGTSTSLTNTGGTPGGTWSCSAGTITSAGVFTGSSAGAVTITYTASTPCGNAYAYFPIVVNPLPTVSAITMPSSICSGASVMASDATPGGFWSVSPATVATVISLTGVVTGLSVGSGTITYSVTNLCGTSAVIHPLAVQALPSVSPIIGVPNVCPGSTSMLTSGPAGGTWSVSNGHATISSSGLLTGISAGIDTISFSITNSCGTATALRIATIYPVPGTDTISGSSIACIGMPVTLTAAVPGGVWTSAGGHTTVTAGVVYGLSTGVDTIRYAETNSCGSAVLTHLMTVHDTVSASVTASVSPNDTICGAAPVTLTASPVNGGTSPNVVWYNGAVVLDTGTSFTYTPSDGDIVHCTMMSNAVCPTPAIATSNNIGLEVYPNVIPSVIVTASPSDTVAFIGQSITFTATLTNCGSSPVYQWYENGTAITGATNATYTTTAAGSDAYYCIAACDTPCAIAVYNHSNVVTLYTGHVGVPGIGNTVAQYSISPNPNTGTFVLDGHGIRNNDAIRYDVLDVAGRQVINGSWQPVNGRIRNEVVMPDVAAGQYILRIFDGSAVVVFRVDVLK